MPGKQVLENQIKEQGDVVRRLKEAKESKEKVRGFLISLIRYTLNESRFEVTISDKILL